MSESVALYIDGKKVELSDFKKLQGGYTPAMATKEGEVFLNPIRLSVPGVDLTTWREYLIRKSISEVYQELRDYIRFYYLESRNPGVYYLQCHSEIASILLAGGPLNRRSHLGDPPYLVFEYRDAPTQEVYLEISDHLALESITLAERKKGGADE